MRLISVYSIFVVFYLGVMNFNLATAQSKPCVFCEIAKKKTQESRVVYRDKTIVAFMDYAPINPGHVLVVPIVHAENILETPDSTASELMIVAKKIAAAIKTTDIRAEGFRMMMNTDKAAGQSVFHAHLHVIPRFTGDKFDEKKERALPAELDAVAAKIRAALGAKL
jgi:histidine triad (HIT) family protein